jgi:predicted small lipoprotein YifL
MRSFPILAGALMLLAACGTRGPLTLPPAKAAYASHLSLVAPVDHTSSVPGARS